MFHLYLQIAIHQCEDIEFILFITCHMLHNRPHSRQMHTQAAGTNKQLLAQPETVHNFPIEPQLSTDHTTGTK